MIFLVCLFYVFFFGTADLRSYCGYFLAICQQCSNFWIGFFPNVFPNPCLFHSRPFFIWSKFLLLASGVMFTCGIFIDFQFLWFFYLIFFNGFPSSLIVRSTPRFSLINENFLNCTSVLGTNNLNRFFIKIASHPLMKSNFLVCFFLFLDCRSTKLLRLFAGYLSAMSTICYFERPFQLVLLCEP